MLKYQLNINGKIYEVEADADKPILWVLRDNLELTGTKYGCGIAQCGACTVLLDGKSTRSCTMPVSAIKDNKITTIEGLAGNKINDKILKLWEEFNVPQCGYCQAGQIMSVVSLLNKNNRPNDDEIDDAMQGNICRCGTYYRIKKAIKELA